MPCDNDSYRAVCPILIFQALTMHRNVLGLSLHLYLYQTCITSTEKEMTVCNWEEGYYSLLPLVVIIQNPPQNIESSERLTHVLFVGLLQPIVFY